MKGKFLSGYRSNNTGRPTFRYAIIGTEQEIAKYEEMQGKFLRKTTEEEIAKDGSKIPVGTPIAFRNRFEGNVCEFQFNKDNSRIYVNNLDELKIEAETSRRGATEAIKAKGAELIFARLGISVATPATATPEATPERVPLEDLNPELDEG